MALNCLAYRLCCKNTHVASDTWLPDAHTEAPHRRISHSGCNHVKNGRLWFFTIFLPIIPDACQEYSSGIIGSSLIAIIYIGLVAIVQKDMKTLIAYSSIAHMGFVTLGILIVFGRFLIKRVP